MRLRRRARLPMVELTPPPDESVRVLRGDDRVAFNAATAVARIERFVGAATASILQVEDRLAHLEAVTTHLTEEVHARPGQSDLLDVRLQAARLESEVRRLALELRAEIAEIKDVADGAPTREQRIASLAEDLLDLTRHDEAS